MVTAPNGVLSAGRRESKATLSATGSVMADGGGPGIGVSAGRSASDSVGAPSGVAAGVTTMRSMPLKVTLIGPPLRTSGSGVPAFSVAPSLTPKSASAAQSSSPTLKL